MMRDIKVVRGDCFQVCADIRNVDLIIVDPPYGGILDEQWDQEWTTGDYARLTDLIKTMLKPHGTAYVWGGVGTPGNRLFFEWLSDLEKRDRSLRLHNLITWKKRRAYGKADNYLFTREECAMLVKGDLADKKYGFKPGVFNIPLLDEKRGYAGYNKDYPAKSEFFRVSNVWTDINELFKGKIHPAEKPWKLAARMIATSSHPGDLVVDMMAGSGSTGVAASQLGRRCLLVERNPTSPMHIQADGSIETFPASEGIEKSAHRYIIRASGHEDMVLSMGADDQLDAHAVDRLRACIRSAIQSDSVMCYTEEEVAEMEART